MNYTVLLINFILGGLLLYSYYFLYNKMRNPRILWGRIKEKYKNLYLLSILLATIGYLLMLNFVVFRVKNNNNKMHEILSFQIIIILASMLWMPLSIRYHKNKNIIVKFLVILTLFTVAIASLGNALKVSSLIVPKKENMYKVNAVVGSLYLFFHTFVVDFLFWNYNFF